MTLRVLNTAHSEPPHGPSKANSFGASGVKKTMEVIDLGKDLVELTK